MMTPGGPGSEWKIFFLLIQVLWTQGDLRLFDLKHVALTKYLNVPMGLEKVSAAAHHDREMSMFRWLCLSAWMFAPAGNASEGQQAPFC